jgi:hypothetical protein
LPQQTTFLVSAWIAQLWLVPTAIAAAAPSDGGGAAP